MAGEKKLKREPFAYISKRDGVSLTYRITVRAAAIVLALVVCGIVTKVLTGDNPISIYQTIVHGAVGKGRLLVTIHDTAILLCISLAVTPAFRMRFWNTGAEGQVLIGCLATAACMFWLGGKVPNGVLILIMTVAAIVSGMIWGVIPAIFKAQWKTNETLFTLMMNYVAIQLVEYFLKIADKSGSNVVGPDLLSHGWLPDIFGVKYLLNIIIVAVITVLMQIYLKYSKHGYEISVVGESENTARYAGINVSRVMIRTMLLSGAICGLCGFLVVAGKDQTISTTSAGGNGFTAIIVAWLAKFNTFYMMLISFLLIFLDRGASEIASAYSLNEYAADIITGIILFFILGSEFFINYRLVWRGHHDGKEGK